MKKDLQLLFAALCIGVIILTLLGVFVSFLDQAGGHYLAIFGFITNLLGLDNPGDRYYDEQARMNEEAQRLRQEGIDYYKRYGSEAEGLRNQAKVGYERYGQMGISDRQSADYHLPDLYAQYGMNTGLTGFGVPRGQATPEQYSAPFPANPDQQPLGPQRVGSQPGGSNAYQSYGDYLTGNQPPQNPYDLDRSQLETLNQNIAAIHGQKATALGEYEAMARQTGGGVSPDVIARINDYYDQQVNQMTTQAQEQARVLQQQSKDRAAQAAAAMINQFTAQRNLGTQQYGGSLDALTNLSQMALQQGSNAPFGQFAGQTANEAVNMGQQGAQQEAQANARFGQMLQLLAFGLSGGFGNMFGKTGGAGAGKILQNSDLRMLPASTFGGSGYIA